MYMIDKVIKTRRPEDMIYLLEDDYLHKPGAKKAILEGLEIADYVTLYDHPDKYMLYSSGGNPFNYKKLQETRLYLTKSTHWRECNSTTMTFATRVHTLEKDYAIWKKYTQSKNPDDFHGFIEITQNSIGDIFSFFIRKRKKEFKILFKNYIVRKKMKKLISSVPAFATHVETKCLSPLFDWRGMSQ